MLNEGELITLGRCCCEGVSRIIPMALPASCTVAISKVTWRFIAGCGCCEGARRMVTIFEVGFSWSAPILKLGVSCSDAISNENVSCTAVCMPLAG